MVGGVEYDSGVSEGGECETAGGCGNCVLHNAGGEWWGEEESVWGQDLGEAMVELQGVAGIQAHFWYSFRL